MDWDSFRKSFARTCEYFRGKTFDAGDVLHCVFRTKAHQFDVYVGRIDEGTVSAFVSVEDALGAGSTIFGEAPYDACSADVTDDGDAIFRCRGPSGTLYVRTYKNGEEPYVYVTTDVGTDGTFDL